MEAQQIFLIISILSIVGLIVFAFINHKKWDKEIEEYNKRPEIICEMATVEHIFTSKKYLVIKTYEGDQVKCRGESGEVVWFYLRELKKIKNPE